jgi:hypothetical protein
MKAIPFPMKIVCLAWVMLIVYAGVFDPSMLGMQ